MQTHTLLSCSIPSIASEQLRQMSGGEGGAYRSEKDEGIDVDDDDVDDGDSPGFVVQAQAVGSE